MSDLLFSQKDGFVDYEPPERLRSRDGEDWEAYKQRAGLEEGRRLDRSTCQNSVERWYRPEFTPGANHTYTVLNVAEGEGEPRYLVEVEGVGAGDAELELVWVKTRGDLLALRIQLSHLLQVEVIGLLADLHVLAKRAFMAHHGHEWDHACNECDPQEAANQRRDREEARKRKEARRQGP